MENNENSSFGPTSGSDPVQTPAQDNGQGAVETSSQNGNSSPQTQMNPAQAGGGQQTQSSSPQTQMSQGQQAAGGYSQNAQSSQQTQNSGYSQNTQGYYGQAPNGGYQQNRNTGYGQNAQRYQGQQAAGGYSQNTQGYQQTRNNGYGQNAQRYQGQHANGSYGQRNGRNTSSASTGSKPVKSRFGIGLLVGVLVTIAAVLVAAVLFVFLGLRAGSNSTMSLDSNEKLTMIKSYLDAYYLGEIDDEAIENGLASGLVSATGDKYAQYYTKEEFEELMEDSSGTYSGIGISVVQNAEGDIEVLRVFSNSPAEEAGIKEYDLIVEAEGVRGFETLEDLVSIVRGEAGTSVNIVVKRGEEEIPMTVERRSVDVDTVIYEMLDNQIGYLCLTEFDTVSIDQFNAALTDLEAQGMKALILDLRDNPGGDYDSVMAIADRVLPEGVIASVVDKNGTVGTEVSDEEHQLTVPAVLLVNGNSASASELFSAAVKDYGVATIVGETTYGKGIIQSIFRLPDGSGMKFTTQEYLSPKGNTIHEVGVTPDVEVTIPDEAYEDGIVTKEEDTQLQKAIEILTTGAAVSAE